MELNAAYILVRRGGKLIVGSCDCPFKNKATLTFWGTNTALNPDGLGTKGVRIRAVKRPHLSAPRSSASIPAALF